MFERFTDSARQAIVAAQEEARLLHHTWIGTEHLLLGLVSAGAGAAVRSVVAQGGELKAVRALVVETLGPGESTEPEPGTSRHVPFTPRAQKVLQMAETIADGGGATGISADHLLLGLVREGDGVAPAVLRRLAVDLDLVEAAVAGDPPAEVVRPVTRADGEHTVAAARALDKARALANGKPVGSHHLLRALLSDGNSAALAAAVAAGVDLESLADAIDSVSVAGTTDESPDQAGARLIEVGAADGALRIEVRHPGLAALAEEAAARLADQTDPPPELERLYASIRDVLRDLGAGGGPPPG